MASPARNTSVRVLVVDDEDLVREVVARGLEDAGFDVHRALDAFEALAHLDACHGACDLLVTDLVMPGKTGAELGKEACERWPHLRVIYMTGFTRDDLARHGVSECPHAVLQKPFTISELCRNIRAMLAA